MLEHPRLALLPSLHERAGALSLLSQRVVALPQIHTYVVLHGLFYVRLYDGFHVNALKLQDGSSIYQLQGNGARQDSRLSYAGKFLYSFTYE